MPKKKKAPILRRVKAFCKSCSPSLNKNEDCLSISCPFYDLRPGNELEPIDWYSYPVSQWTEAEECARTGKELPERKQPTREQKEAGKRLARKLRKRKDDTSS